jgi:hypothetical protein
MTSPAVKQPYFTAPVKDVTPQRRIPSNSNKNANLLKKALVISIFLGILSALFYEGRLTSGICGIGDSLRLRQ